MRVLISLIFCLSLLTCYSESKFSALKIEELKEIFKDTSRSKLTRVEAQESVVLKTLYSDYQKGYSEVQKFLRFSQKHKLTFHELFAYHCLVYYYRKADQLDSAFYCNDKYLELALKHKKGYHFTRALNDRAVLFEFSGNYEEALKRHLASIDSSIKYKQVLSESRARINAGNLLQIKGDFQEALFQLKAALEIINKNKFYGYKASTLYYLGNIFASIKEYKEAENYYKESLVYSKMKNNNGTRILTYIGLSNLYFYQNNFNKAINYTDSLFLLGAKLDLLSDQSYSCYLRSKIYNKQKQLDSAQLYINKALRLYENVKIKKELYAYKSLAGQIQFNLGNFIKAKKYCEQSYEMNQEKKDNEIQKINCDCLFKLHKKLGNTKLALYYYEEKQMYVQKSNEENQIKEIVKFQITAENNKLRALDSINNSINISNIKKELNQKIELRNKQVFVVFLIFIFVLFIALGSLFFLNKIRNQKENLMRMDRLNKQIFSIISHDFIGPISSLEYLIKVMDNPNVTSNQLQSIKKDVNNQLDITTHILNDLLTWSKVELNIELQKIGDCKVNEIVEGVLNGFNSSIIEKKLTVKNTLSKELKFTANKQVLQIIFRNLISNCVKYSYEGGEILILNDSKNKTIEIQDRGKGMTEDIQAKLFKTTLFSSIGTNKENGFGIGLYFTGELINKLGWSIKAKSQLNKGTTFIISYR